MPKYIAFVSPKGGSGATFCCAGVWRAMAKSGINVLAVDFGGQCSSLDFALGFQNDSVYNVCDVVNKTCSLDEALCTSPYEQNSAFLRGDINTKADADRFMDVADKSDFEYVLMDFANESDALNCAFDMLLVVTDGTQTAVRMCEAFANSLEWDNTYIIINKLIPQYIKSGNMPTADEILDSIGLRPLGLIPWSPDILAVSGCGGDVLQDRNLADAFSNIAMRIMGENVPAIDFNINYDCFKMKKRR